MAPGDHQVGHARGAADQRHAASRSGIQRRRQRIDLEEASNTSLFLPLQVAPRLVVLYVTSTCVVKMSNATEAAFCSATRSTWWDR